jgi:hypothetical protein
MLAGRLKVMEIVHNLIAMNTALELLNERQAEKGI